MAFPSVLHAPYTYCQRNTEDGDVGLLLRQAVKYNTGFSSLMSKNKYNFLVIVSGSRSTGRG